MKQTIIFAAMALIAIAGVGGCRKNSTPQQATSTSAVTENQHPEGGTTPAGEKKYFSGSIGSALGLQMKLVREGERLTGSYFYKKVGTPIDVRGTVDKDGNVVLEEFDSNGKQTGVFKGTWKTDENGLIEIEGNWTKPNGDKKTAFSLHEEPIEFSGGVEIIARQIREKNKKLKYEIDAEYPQLTGSTDPNFEKFNQTVRSLVTRKVTEFKKEMAQPEEGETAPDSADESSETTGSDLSIGYTIALAKDDLISVLFDIGSYYRGAAHPNSYSETVNFDLKNGRSLKLGDLFKPGTKYLQIISGYCIQDLKKQSKANGADSMLDDDWIQRGAGPNAENYKSWTITRKGLGINFDSYQVAPYAAGPQHVLVPYPAVKEIINPEGPIGQFAK
jgi:uncharacterized protein DUF3298/peptidoglycan-N-acetylmuramic acid deacetylase PdaC-like protein